MLAGYRRVRVAPSMSALYRSQARPIRRPRCHPPRTPTWRTRRPALKQELLEAIGASSVEELFAQIPASAPPARRARPAARARRPRSSCAGTCATCCARNDELRGRRSASSAAAAGSTTCRRSATSSSRRTEFVTLGLGHARRRTTAATRPGSSSRASSASCSTLDFVGLPVYSWGCAAGHAIRMASRITGRREVLVPGVARSRAPRRDPHLLRAARDGEPHRRRARRPRPGDRACSTSPTSSASSPTGTAAVYFENPSYLGADRGRGGRDRPARARRAAPRRSSASTRSRSACSRRPATTAPTSWSARRSRSACT